MAADLALSAAQTFFAALQNQQLKDFCDMLGYETHLKDLEKSVSTAKNVLKDAEIRDGELSLQQEDYIEKLMDAVDEADDLFEKLLLEKYETGDILPVNPLDKMPIKGRNTSVQKTGEVLDMSTNKISVKCRGRRLVKLIDDLNEVQRVAVNSIGFGGLLEFRLKQFPLAAVPLFLKAFNDGSHMFRASGTKEFLLTKHDVHDCFLLPLGTKQLELVPTGRKKSSESEDECYKNLKDRWRSLFNIKNVGDSIPLGKVLEELVAAKKGGDQFKRLFVLFSMSSFLCPTSNNALDMKLVKAVEDVSSICEYDWCSYVLDGMVKAGVESRDDPTFILGCIPFLMISYFHRFDFRGESLPADLPLIRHWNDDKMNTRIKAEMVTGRLGRAPWSKLNFPLCLHDSSNSAKYIQSTPAMNLSSPPRLPLKFYSPTRDHSNKNKFIQIQLPEGVDDDQELKDRAVDGLHELYLQLQRNAIVFHTWYSQTTDKIKKLSTRDIANSEGLLSQTTQRFFNDVALHQYVDEVVEISKPMKQSVSKAPVFSEATTAGPLQEDITHDFQTDYGVGSVIRELRADNTLGIDADDECETEAANENVAAKCTYIPTSDSEHHPFLLHSSKPLGCMVIVPENLGCSVDCGGPISDQTVVSDVLVRNKEAFEGVFSLRKDVMDYVFIKSDKTNKLETLVHYTDVYFIPREELQTLEPGMQVGNIVIECWSVLLNNLNYIKTAVVASSRCFFGLNQMAFTRQMWNGIRDGSIVDMSEDVFRTWDLWVETFKELDL